MSPIVSVVIPTHNRPDMLADALASVRAQTFTDYEIIVVSNGEGADMGALSQAFAHANDARYFCLPDGNVSAARNFGVAQAYGKWIAFLDDDDLWLTNKLERQVAEAERTGADMVTCDYAEVHSDGREIVRRWRLLAGWSHVKAINHGYWTAGTPTVLMRKSVLKKLGGFDPALRYAEDIDLWRRTSQRHVIHQVPEVLVRVRNGHASLTQNKRAQDFYDLRHCFKMYRDTPVDLRSTLPWAVFSVTPRLIALAIPQWLRRRLRPRTRIAQFRHWVASLAAERPKLPDPEGPPKPRPDHPQAGFYRPPRQPAQPVDRPSDLPEAQNSGSYL